MWVLLTTLFPFLRAGDLGFVVCRVVRDAVVAAVAGLRALGSIRATSRERAKMWCPGVLLA